MSAKDDMTGMSPEVENGAVIKVVNTIDASISARSSQLSLDGLTLSTLAFGGASLVWFLVSDTSLSSSLNSLSLMLYVLVFVCFRFLKAIWSALNNSRNVGAETPPKLLILWVQRLHGGPRIVLEFVHGVALCWFVILIFPETQFLRWFVAISFLSSLPVFLHAYWPVGSIDWTVIGGEEYPLSDTGKAIFAIYAFLIFVIWVLSSIGGIVFFRENVNVFEISNVQIVLAGIAGYGIAYQMAQRLGDQKVLRRLIELRDLISYGVIHPEIGWQKAKALSASGDAFEMVRAEVEKISQLVETQREAIQVFIGFVSAIKTAAKESQGGEIQKSRIREIIGPKKLREFDKTQKKIQKGQKKLVKLQKSAVRKARIADWVFGTPDGVFLALKREFAKQIRSLDEVLGEMDTELGELKQVMEDRGKGRTI